MKSTKSPTTSRNGRSVKPMATPEPAAEPSPSRRHADIAESNGCLLDAIGELEGSEDGVPIQLTLTLRRATVAALMIAVADQGIPASQVISEALDRQAQGGFIQD